jgi:LacI family transcriptional regulator
MVAEAAGVHMATASRALNPETRKLVKADTARQVISVAKRLGYQPNPLARALRTNNSNLIGVIIPDLTNPLYPPIVRGIDDELASAAYVPILANTDNNLRRERSLYEAMQHRQVDGFIFATARVRHPLLTNLHDSGVPVVLLIRTVAGREIPSVVPDDELGMRLAVGHLVELGHERIAHIAGPSNVSSGLDRRAAFLRALEEHQLDPESAVVVEARSFETKSGLDGCRKALDRGDFSAVVAGNDLMALGCLEAFEERGIRCPQDMSLVGFNDMPFLDRINPPLTTIRVPHHDLGTEAARLLLERLRDPTLPVKQLKLAPQLIVRKSSAAYRPARSLRRLPSG